MPTKCINSKFTKRRLSCPRSPTSPWQTEEVSFKQFTYQDTKTLAFQGFQKPGVRCGEQVDAPSHGTDGMEIFLPPYRPRASGGIRYILTPTPTPCWKGNCPTDQKGNILFLPTHQ